MSPARRRADAQGDLFDPEAKLNQHATEEHAGKTIPACGMCRDLSQAVVESGRTYSYSGEGRCRFCDAEILWFRTPNAEQMPVDRDRFFEAWPELGKVNALRGFWTTSIRGREVVLAFNHWATCPNVAEARQKGGAWYEEAPPSGKDSTP